MSQTEPTASSTTDTTDTTSSTATPSSGFYPAPPMEKLPAFLGEAADDNLYYWMTEQQARAKLPEAWRGHPLLRIVPRKTKAPEGASTEPLAEDYIDKEMPGSPKAKFWLDVKVFCDELEAYGSGKMRSSSEEVIVGGNQRFSIIQFNNTFCTLASGTKKGFADTWYRNLFALVEHEREWRMEKLVTAIQLGKLDDRIDVLIQNQMPAAEKTKPHVRPRRPGAIESSATSAEQVSTQPAEPVGTQPVDLTAEDTEAAETLLQTATPRAAATAVPVTPASISLLKKQRLATESDPTIAELLKQFEEFKKQAAEKDLQHQRELQRKDAERQAELARIRREFEEQLAKERKLSSLRLKYKNPERDAARIREFIAVVYGLITDSKDTMESLAEQFDDFPEHITRLQAAGTHWVEDVETVHADLKAEHAELLEAVPEKP